MFDFYHAKVLPDSNNKFLKVILQKLSRHKIYKIHPIS